MEKKSQFYLPYTGHLIFISNTEKNTLRKFSMISITVCFFTNSKFGVHWCAFLNKHVYYKSLSFHLSIINPAASTIELLNFKILTNEYVDGIIILNF